MMHGQTQVKSNQIKLVYEILRISSFCLCRAI